MTIPIQAVQAKSDRKRPRILVVDDHDAGRKSLARLLDAQGYDVVAVNDGASALAQLQGSARFDHVLTDLRLPDLDGRDVVHAARQLVPLPGIYLITGWDLEPAEIERLNIDSVFQKPLNVHEIVARLQEVSPPDSGTGEE